MDKKWTSLIIILLFLLVVPLSYSAFTTYTYPFTTPANYTYNSSKIEVSGGLAQLKSWNLNSTNFVSGSSEYINYGQDSSLRVSNNFSVFAWINSTSAATGGIVGRYVTSGTNRAWYLAINVQGGGGDLAVVMSKDGTYTAGNRKYYYSSESVTDGNWHLVGLTFVDNSLKMYIDGEEINPTKTYDDAFNSVHDPAVNLTQGAYNSPAANFFDGQMDEVSLWNVSLSSAEVAEIYNGGYPLDLSSHSQGSKLVSWWRMGDGDSTSTMYDNINNNDGDIVGADIRNAELLSYYTDNPSIYNYYPLDFSSVLSNFKTAESVSGADGIKYHVSSDNGSSWKYWDGGAWVATDGSYTQANTNDTVNTNLVSLASAGNFSFRALLYSSNGSTTPTLDYVTIEQDANAPGISNVNATATDSTAQITWDTDENSNSSIIYGLTITILNLSAGQDDSVTSHSVNIASLSAETLYYYNVTSCDATGNCNTTGPYNFTALALQHPNPFNVAAGTITNQSAVISWETLVNANSSVEYGTTLALGSFSNSVGLVKNHSRSLSGLLNFTLYYYNVTSCAGSSCNTTGPYNFTTLQSTTYVNFVTIIKPVNDAELVSGLVDFEVNYLSTPDECYYVLENITNRTFDCDTEFIVDIPYDGWSQIVIYAQNSTGSWHNDNVTFYVERDFDGAKGFVTLILILVPLIIAGIFLYIGVNLESGNHAPLKLFLILTAIMFLYKAFHVIHLVIRNYLHFPKLLDAFDTFDFTLIVLAIVSYFLLYFLYTVLKDMQPEQQ
jgi:hypothetical protein